ncbi:unnamed protein product [Rotaria magnacalcarata]|uniref:Hermes trasposase DNA-binding domain-containing protein n=2 Tax=Rotaria magnacalcarata TaxID=392030 RepID=A0A816CU80_9BILA|nr:unnamed protein product [Rotaria magnacalcarata]CAF1646613.1 unnamed protein product [Rotaria magnacalcarata]CAF3823062.1 unnamed protein product [Rotaria magnacalcarata]CAF3853573.1 unnamed protein product [Rotaria magnacalcarata]
MCAAEANPVRLTKKDIEQLIEEKDTSLSSSLSYSKPTQRNRKSKYWSKFSQIYVSNIKQDFIICDSCRTLLVCKSATGSGCMSIHSRACEGKDNELNLSNQQRKLNHYYNSTSTSKNVVPKAIKNAITQSCVEFVVEDGRTFHLLQCSGFVGLVKQLFDAGNLTPSSREVNIHDLLPDPT